MSEPTASLESLDAQGNGLCVEFVKQKDRFAHTICGVRSGEKTPLFRSLEGTPEEYSPPSPSFAELHQQGSVLFLSGATTIAHWSMSLEVIEQRIVFDVACRMKAALEILGSEYRLLSSQHAKLLEWMPAEGTSLQRGEESVRAVPSSQRAAQFPATLQWRYHIAAKAH